MPCCAWISVPTSTFGGQSQGHNCLTTATPNSVIVLLMMVHNNPLCCFIFLSLNMAMLSKIGNDKPVRHNPPKFLNLSFTNILGIRSKFAAVESFLLQTLLIFSLYVKLT